MSTGKRGRVLFVGQSYYNTLYLSRELQRLGWVAHVFNSDANLTDDMYYHGEDFKFRGSKVTRLVKLVIFYIRAIFQYEIFHFTGVGNLRIIPNLVKSPIGFLFKWLPDAWDTRLLKRLGKKIVYTNTGCHDGVSQSSFRKWSGSVCDICKWRDVPSVCSDELNLRIGKLRNSLTHYQVLLGSNRADYNIGSNIHEVPEFYCLDKNFWSPDLLIPSNYRLAIPDSTIKLFHAVGNFQSRTDNSNKNIKSTHIYMPLINQLKAEGYSVELIFFYDVPNSKLRFYQAQADIFLDMLQFGWFGATAREGMMLGKPVICYLRPEWLEDMRKEIPDYVDELPIISATPETIYDVLVDLICNPQKRIAIGKQSREFALKWHSAEAGGARLDQIYSSLLQRQ